MDALLVLGVGNLLRADDGLGVWAVQALLEESWPAGITLLDAGTFTQDLVDPLLRAKRLLVLDAVKMGSPCGTIRRLTRADLLDESFGGLSLHDMGLLEALSVCERRAGHAPDLTILGMEPYDVTSWYMELSMPLQTRFNAYLTAARHCIAELTQSSDA
ncbi:MAG TPA: hydrogenase maturation protease [Candidatus Avidesulfovibrio excrementigallinarum]|nr:hydrogenase maturation protease [Candidatus Avidesulfovibrio excrementigallinarum]